MLNPRRLDGTVWQNNGRLKQKSEVQNTRRINKTVWQNNDRLKQRSKVLNARRLLVTTREENVRRQEEEEEEGDYKSYGSGKLKNFTVKYKNNDKDVSIFASISGSDLKKEVAKNIVSSMKTDIVDIFITGPFRNVKSDKSTLIGLFGGYGSAWTLKSQFIKGYIGNLLTKVNKPNIDTGHSSLY